ncbi:hypothetical protein B0H21DRAFT_506058 [Amylocystis lapponica]|nr:hypothetical protein B0H21DRAFT_506058 [Amylocystis lapponica]
MDGRTNPSTRKDLPPRFALITPSASPPSSRSSYASRGRRTDRAPSAKRPRLASTPSSAFSASTPSSSAQPDANQIDEDRRASSLRLMNFWSQLGERYNRPLDEDDIIDLRDGSLHKNRGVLQGVDHIYDLGYFAAGDGASDANATDTASEGGGPPENEDDDVDEIDAFAPEANISDELEMEKEKLHVPPVRAMDPADAEDLREFLEAEQRRKELHGDDEEDEEVDPMLLRGESLGLNWPNLFRGENGDEVQSAEGEDDGVSIYDGDGASVAYEEEAGHPVAPTKVKAPAVQKALLRVPSDDESEDEFATWDFDVSTPAPRPRTGQRPPDEDVIDLTDSPSPSPPPPPQRAKSRAPARGPSRPASRARSKSRPQARLPKTPPRSEFKTPPPPSPEPITQLFTPPRSSVSAVENTPDVLQSCDIEYPSPPPPPRVRPRPRPAYKGAQHSADTPTGSSTAVAPLPPRDPPAESCITKLKPTKTPKTVHTAEVVLTRRSRRPSTTVKITDDNLHLSKARRQDEHNNHEGEVSDPERRLTRKEKGKGKDLPSFVDSHAQSDTEHPDGQVSNTEAKKTAQKAKPRGKAKAKQKSDDVGTTPKTSHGLPSRTGKRKRIVSSSPAFGQSTNEQPSVDISPVAHVKSKLSISIAFRRRKRRYLRARTPQSLACTFPCTSDTPTGPICVHVPASDAVHSAAPRQTWSVPACCASGSTSAVPYRTSNPSLVVSHECDFRVVARARLSARVSCALRNAPRALASVHTAS